MIQLDLTDSELVQKVLQGDCEAFGELVKRYQHQVFTLAYRYLGNREEAADAAQDAFVKAYQGLNGFRQEAGFKTWLYQITSNSCRDRLRKRKYEPLVILDQPVVTPEGQYTREIAGGPSPEEEAERREFHAYLQNLINNLTVEYKEVLILREIEGLSYEAIASRLDLSMGTVKSRLNRARRALRDQILKDRELSRWPVV